MSSTGLPPPRLGTQAALHRWVKLHNPRAVSSRDSHFMAWKQKNPHLVGLCWSKLAMFSDNELRLKCLCFFLLVSPFRSPCGMPLSATEMSEKSVWVGRFLNLLPPSEIAALHIPILCSCTAWIILELCTVSSGFSFLMPLWGNQC